jgi:adenosylcobinamide-phosphate guanylyltransferase
VKCDGVECVYTGISIINADKIKNSNTVKEKYIILDDKRIAFNLNTKRDYELLNSS